jgi:hypothetical protein
MTNSSATEIRKSKKKNTDLRLTTTLAMLALKPSKEPTQLLLWSKELSNKKVHYNDSKDLKL